MTAFSSRAGLGFTPLAILGLALALAVSIPAPVEGSERPKLQAAQRTAAPSSNLDAANWAVYGRTPDENHYSPLAQIDEGNVAGLKLAAFTDLPRSASVVSEPLAVDGVVYLGVGLSVLHAINAKTGKIVWKYDPGVAAVAGPKLRAAWGIRGISYWRGKVITGTQDGRLIAVNAKSGKLVWSVQTTEKDDGRYITGAPRVFNGKVVIGHGGADFGTVRGYVTAYNAETGRKLWRFHTVPGNPADGFESEAMRMAATTWNGEWWKYGGGGTVWNSMTYDSRFNRLYLGVGNGSPWNQRIRSPGGGDNLFLASIVALDADTGQYVWHYQQNPGETWDWNACMDIELTDLQVNGQLRPVILHAPKNGFFYVIDRETGKVLSAEKFAKANWAERIDLATGRPVENPEARYAAGPALVFPASAGAHGPEAMSFNPKLGLAFIPTREAGKVYSDAGVEHASWRPTPGLVPNTGLSAATGQLVAPAPTSSLVAWDPVKQARVWSVPTPGLTGGGTATTAGNLVFQGRADGSFVAYSARTGEQLWTFDAQAGILAAPISYAVGGKQYVSVIVGFGGVNAAMGGAPFGWDYAQQKRRLLTFSLEGTAKLPAEERKPLALLDDPRIVLDPQAVRTGAQVYNQRCVFCHGVRAVSGGTAPDLRASPIALSKEAFEAVVRKGALSPAGMPAFGEMTDEEIQGLFHYVRSAQRESQAQAEQR